MLMHNLGGGGQTKSIMVFLKVAYLHVFLIVPQVPVAVQYFSFVQQEHRWRIFPVYVTHLLEQRTSLEAKG